MVHVDLGVVVEGGGRGLGLADQIQVVLSGVLPPGPKGRLVVVSAVAVVMKPQTEAGSGQSERPDLGVLSVAADRGSQPLLSQVSSDLRVSPRERVLAVTDHVERLVPAALGGNHLADAEQH